MIAAKTGDYMTSTGFLDTDSGRRIAYVKTDGDGPTVVFLGGYKSDMDGTKAVWLEEWCRDRGRAFLRFDYSGHGQSSGEFADGCIGDWADDAEAVIRATCDGPLVLVGSSMGGWISLLMTRRLEMIAGLVTIAAAPDFSEDSFWDGFSDAQRTEVMAPVDREGFKRQLAAAVGVDHLIEHRAAVVDEEDARRPRSSPRRNRWR